MIAIAALLALIAAGCSGAPAIATLSPATTPAPTASPSPMPSATSRLYTLAGTLSVHGASHWDFTASGCVTNGGYDDIEEGVGVTVKDEAGKIIATGELRAGDLEIEPLRCSFPFTVVGIPKATFYSIEVGHRGELNYSFEELEGRYWTVAFSLGE